jgi:hypothetical protein
VAFGGGVEKTSVVEQMEAKRVVGMGRGYFLAMGRLAW